MSTKNRSESVPAPYGQGSRTRIRRQLDQLEMLPRSRSREKRRSQIQQSLTTPKHQENSIDLEQSFLPEIRQSSQPPSNAIMKVRQSLLEPQAESLLMAKKMQALSENARFFEAQTQPLFLENRQLKDELIALQDLLRVRTRELSNIVLLNGRDGENRGIVKKIGDIEELLQCVREDYGMLGTNVKQLSAAKEELEKNLTEVTASRSKIIEDNIIQIALIKQQEADKYKSINASLTEYKQANSVLEKKLNDEKSLRFKQVEMLEKELKNQKEIQEELKGFINQQQIEHKEQMEVFQLKTDGIIERASQEKRELIQWSENRINKLTEAFNSQINELNSKLENSEAHFTSQLVNMTALRDEFQKELQQLQVSSKNHIESLTGQVEQLNKLKVNMQEKMAEVNATNQQINMLNSQLNTKLGQLKEDNYQLEIELDGLKEEFQDFTVKKTAEISGLKQKMQILEQNRISKEAEWVEKLNDARNKSSEELRNQLMEQQNQYEDLIRKTRRELEERMIRSDNEKDEMITAVTKKLRDREEEIALVKRDLTKVRKELTEKIKEYEDKLKLERMEAQNKEKVLRDQNELLQRKLVDARLEGADHLDNVKKLMGESEAENLRKQQERELYWKQRINEVTDEMERQNKLELEQVNLQHKKEIEDMQVEFAEQIRLSKEKLTQEKEQQLNELANKHKNQIEKLKAEFADKERCLHEEADNFLKNTKKDYEQKLKELRNQLADQEQKRIARETADSEKITSLTELSEKLTKELKDMTELARVRQVEIDELKLKIVEFDVFLQNERRVNEKEFDSLQEQKKQITQLFADREKKLQEEYERQLNKALAEQVAFVEAMKAKFLEMSQANKQRDGVYEGQFFDLQKKFEERPSRPEDLKQIKMLVNSIEQTKKTALEAEAKALRANEIVKYLQLELENYKNVYDIFGPNKKGPQNQDSQSLQSQQNDQNLSQQSQQLAGSPLKQKQQQQQQQQQGQQQQFQFSLSPLQQQSQGQQQMQNLPQNSQMLYKARTGSPEKMSNLKQSNTINETSNLSNNSSNNGNKMGNSAATNSPKLKISTVGTLQNKINNLRQKRYKDSSLSNIQEADQQIPEIQLMDMYHQQQTSEQLIQQQQNQQSPLLKERTSLNKRSQQQQQSQQQSSNNNYSNKKINEDNWVGQSASSRSITINQNTQGVASNNQNIYSNQNSLETDKRDIESSVSGGNRSQRQSNVININKNARQQQSLGEIIGTNSLQQSQGSNGLIRKKRSSKSRMSDNSFKEQSSDQKIRISKDSSSFLNQS